MAGLWAEDTTSGCSEAAATDERRELPSTGLVCRSLFASRCSLAVALDAVAVRHVQWGGAAVRDPEDRGGGEPDVSESRDVRAVARRGGRGGGRRAMPGDDGAVCEGEAGVVGGGYWGGR